jgi:two-component system, NarL family, nitrate/nitrite response regulator NarL
LRILVVDDSEAVHRLVRILLRHKSDWEVCGDAVNGQEAISKVRELSPDVVILDLTMPVMNGFEAAAGIRQIAPSIKIIFYTLHDVPSTVSELGDAFVSKFASGRELIATLERVTGRSQGIRRRATSA